MAPVMARVLADRGASALVVRGEDGLDELTLAAPTRVWLVAGGEVRETEVDAAALGLDRAPLSALRGGESLYNAEVAREVFAGKDGAVRDAVVLNAAAAFAAFDGLTTDITSNVDAALSRGLDRARASIDSGAAADTLARWGTVARAAG
jgi:anthranilate phosphoribosyltransferase